MDESAAIGCLARGRGVQLEHVWLAQLEVVVAAQDVNLVRWQRDAEGSGLGDPRRRRERENGGRMEGQHATGEDVVVAAATRSQGSRGISQRVVDQGVADVGEDWEVHPCGDGGGPLTEDTRGRKSEGRAVVEERAGRAGERVRSGRRVAGAGHQRYLNYSKLKRRRFNFGPHHSGDVWLP